MARKQRTSKKNKQVTVLTPVEELQGILQTGITVSELAKHLMRVNVLLRDGLANGEVQVPNADFFRRLQNEMNSVAGLTFRINDGVLELKKPSMLGRFYSGLCKKVRGMEERVILTQAQRLMQEQHKALNSQDKKDMLYANTCPEEN
jgi:hypothetical protein